jgi:hypothetical protein
LAKDTNVKFLFVTPERVVKSTRFFAFLRQQVDQARLARYSDSSPTPLLLTFTRSHIIDLAGVPPGW